MSVANITVVAQGFEANLATKMGGDTFLLSSLSISIKTVEEKGGDFLLTHYLEAFSCLGYMRDKIIVAECRAWRIVFGATA